MRALLLERFGLGNLRIGDVPAPSLGATDALLSVSATSLNHRDLLVVEGKYDARFPLPLIPCSDAVGTVLEVGEAVPRELLGKRVLPAFAPHWLSGPPVRPSIRQTLGGPLAGAACELMVVPAAALVPAPAHLDDAEAATLPCAAVTAYSALFDLSQHGESAAWSGAWVLCQGTGGVSLFALQLAKAVGASVAVISSDDEKLELARRLGADITLNYRVEEDWGRKIRELTGGVDHVIEVGGPGTLARSFKACAPGATIGVVGSLAGPAASLDFLPAVMNQIRVQGVYVGSRETLAKTAAFFEKHRIRPHVHETFALDDAPSALALLAEKGHVGKLCITIR